jgi:predicted CopG family antitoxin
MNETGEMKRVKMPKDNKRYSLKLLFDNTQISKEELEQKAKDVLQNFLPNIHLSVDAMYSTSLQLTLEGELEIIDTCHDKVNKVLITPSQLKTKRLLDEVGDEIRQQAYPILAAIEQRFRVFVSQALTEVSGFDWWNTTAPADLRSKVQPIQEKHQEDGTPLDPLECTQFDDLIKIITAETSEWSESRILSVSDFRELLSNCASVAEVRDKLIEKTNKFAFWDVFARYFQDKKEWDKIKKLINFVINERHKVMHHRPIRLGVIKALLTKKEEIFALLDTAKPELSEKERNDAKQDIQDLWDTSSIDLRDLPTNVAVKAQMIIAGLAAQMNYHQFGGKRLRHNRWIISIPVTRNYRLICHDYGSQVVPLAVLSHEDYAVMSDENYNVDKLES